MKRIFKVAGKRKLLPAPQTEVDKEIVSPSEDNKSVFSMSSLKETPKRSVEDIQRAFAQGRFAELTPDQAG
jgi:hypothetical protein